MLFFHKDLLSYPESPEKSFKTYFKTLKCKGDTISQKNTSKFFQEIQNCRRGSYQKGPNVMRKHLSGTMEHLFSVLIMFGHFKKHKGVVPLIVFIFILPIVYGCAFKFGMPRVYLECHYFRLKINQISLQRSKRKWFRFNCAIVVHLK